jgi:hypothetical protein
VTDEAEVELQPIRNPGATSARVFSTTHNSINPLTRNTKLSGEDKEGYFDNQIRGRKTQKTMRHTDIKRNINLTYFSNMLSQ